MITRKEAQNYLIKYINEEIKKKGKNTIFIISPKTGKNNWTYEEYKEAIVNDKCLENSKYNPIDSLIKYDKYLTEKRGYGIITE